MYLALKIISWVLSNSLDSESSLRVVRYGIETSGKPEILNSDQGSQCAFLEYTNLLKREKRQISMDGKGGALDNS